MSICCVAAIGIGPSAKGFTMRSVLKSGFLWQFAGGFALGAVALVTLHPTEGARATTPTEAKAPATR
jgi:hypothetical protein